MSNWATKFHCETPPSDEGQACFSPIVEETIPIEDINYQ